MSIREYLRVRQVPFITLLHRPVDSAARVAQSLHVRGDCVAKGVLFRAGSAYVLAVVPSTQRVGVERLANVLGLSDLELATEDEVSRVFHDCQPGALPPFGSVYGLTTVVDPHVLSQREIVVESNTRHEGIRLRASDYAGVERPIVARVGQAISPPRRPLRPVPRTAPRGSSVASLPGQVVPSA